MHKNTQGIYTALSTGGIGASLFSSALTLARGLRVPFCGVCARLACLLPSLSINHMVASREAYRICVSTPPRQGGVRPPAKRTRTQQEAEKKTNEGGMRSWDRGDHNQNRQQRPPKSQEITEPRTTPTDPPPPQPGTPGTNTYNTRKKKAGWRNPAHGDPHTTPQRRRHRPPGQARTDDHQGQRRTATSDGASRQDR